MSQRVRRSVMDGYGLPQRASIVREHFNRTYGPLASSKIADSLRSLLYRGQSWRGGEYSDSVALLCREWTRRRRSIFVVTTNYDQYLEASLSQVSEDAGTAELAGSYSLVQRSAGGSKNIAEDLRNVDTAIAVLHIHGVVPEVNGQGIPPDDIVLDDGDYFRTEKQTAALLSNLFTNRDVLILGSGLEDAPLLRALWNNKSNGKRWAIYPRQNLSAAPGAYGAVDRTPDDLIYILGRRMSEFCVDVIAPDFFSQAAQFTREVCIALDHEVGDNYARPSFGSRYSARLEDWWSKWFAPRKDDQAGAQCRDHRSLVSEIEPIRRILGDEEEKLKLELWVRWQPSSTCRILKLWCSSTGTWADPDIMREVEIEANSPYACVQVFCEGAARVGAANTKFERWRKYLAVPIRNGERKNSLQVGVLVLSTMRSTGTLLDEENGGILSLLVNRLVALGDGLLQTS